MTPSSDDSARPDASDAPEPDAQTDTQQTDAPPAAPNEQDNPLAALLESDDPAYIAVLRASLDFRAAMAAYTKHAERSMTLVGLTVQQFHLLLAVKLSDDPIAPTIGDLAEQFALSHVAIVQMVNRLVEKGLLYRQDDPINGRMSRVIHTQLTCDIIKRVSTTSISIIDGVGLTDMRKRMRVKMDALRDAETAFIARLRALGVDINP